MNPEPATDPPFFSVVIPTYNRCDMLRAALDSVRRQTFTDYEVIVVDSLSDDGTEAMIAGLNAPVRYIREKNGGPGPARNIGIRAAEGTYIAFLDSDDLWFPWTLETYADVIATTDRPAFVTGKPQVFEDTATLVDVKPAPARHNAFADYYASGDAWRWFGVSSFVVRADALREAGGFDDRGLNAEDADLALRLGTAPGFVELTAPLQFAYRAHDANLTKNEKQNLAGLQIILDREESGDYPGGTARRRERRRIIARHLRPLCLACLKSGQRADGWSLYRRTLRWHLAAGNVRFALAFPVLAAASALRRR